MNGPDTNEMQYLNLLREVREYGEERKNRTGTNTFALFGPQLVFDLGVDLFPLVTTKKVFWKGIVVELLWMLSGSSRTDFMTQNGVKIWDAWAKADYRPEMGYPEGELGPVYGVQWRKWLVPSLVTLDSGHLETYYVGERIDQIAQIVDKLRHHRDDRRIILSAWNVGEIDRMKLPPCHYAAQFHVDNDLGLHCLMSIRSWDLFLGGPFNIAQYALLTSMLAHVSGLTPRRLIINAGDAHIYANHLEQVDEQCRREIRTAPKLVLDPDVKEIDDFKISSFELVGYDPHPALKGEIAV